MTALATRYEQTTESAAAQHGMMSAADGKTMARNLTPAQKRAVMFAQQQILRAKAARQAKDDRQAALSRMWANADREETASDHETEVRSSDKAAEGQISLRKVIGEVLRNLRTKDHKTLREVSSKAGVSLGYLSEVERGQKEASSELLVSITQALGVRLSDMLMMVSDRVRAIEG